MPGAIAIILVLLIFPVVACLGSVVIAAVLGISRWTLDRDLAAVEHAAADYERFRIALAKLPQQEADR